MRTILQNARLAVFDFDNTVANSFAPSPNGMDVHKAYDMALERIFGKKDLLASLGGLKNRAPTELIHDVLVRHPQLIFAGMETYDSLRERLAKVIGYGKGIPLGTVKNGEHEALFGEMLVRLKLELLMGEVGPTWPRPFDGILELFDDLRTHGKSLAIISSGHDAFIRKCFRMWGAPCVEVVLSDDDLRPLPGPLSHKMKPNRILIDYVLMMASRARIRVRSSDIVYFGDDVLKDGGLARNADIPFGWYNPSAQSSDALVRSDDYMVTSWQDVRASLR